MDSGASPHVGELMIKTAKQIMDEIADTDPDMIEARERDRLLSKPLKDPKYPGQQRVKVYPETRKPRVLPVRYCDIPGCTEKHKSNGYCLAHNYRFKTYGSPYAGRVPRVMLGKTEGLG